jgi:aminopeptidase-like protein
MATPIIESRDSAEAVEVGREIHQPIAELCPIRRSITGNGGRETLRRIS